MDGFGTNWINASKKKSKVGYGGYMVIVWGDCCCFDECNVWEWKVSGRHAGTVDRLIYYIFEKNNDLVKIIGILQCCFNNPN